MLSRRRRLRWSPRWWRQQQRSHQRPPRLLQPPTSRHHHHARQPARQQPQQQATPSDEQETVLAPPPHLHQASQTRKPPAPPAPLPPRGRRGPGACQGPRGDARQPHPAAGAAFSGGRRRTAGVATPPPRGLLHLRRRCSRPRRKGASCMRGGAPRLTRMRACPPWPPLARAAWFYNGATVSYVEEDCVGFHNCAQQCPMAPDMNTGGLKIT